MKTTLDILSENVEKILKRDNRVLLRGLPGVGKTHFCFKFCENSNRNYIIVDCEYDYFFLEKMLSLRNDYSFNEEFRKLCEINSDNFSDTILVFENIEYSEVFCHRIYPIILEKNFTLIMTCRTLNPTISYIAAYTAQFEIHPESFLDAFSKVARLKNYTDMIQGHTATLKHVPELLHREFTRECEYYMHYGGLPLAVSTYLDSDKNLEELKTIHDANRYYALEKLLDISDLSDLDKFRCRQVIDSVFEQMLYTDYNRYKFKSIRKGSTHKDYMHIINFLVDNGILIKVQNTELDEAFVLYYYDCGVLYHRLLQLSNRRNSADYDQNIQKIVKRNFVVTELVSRHITPYYRKAKNKAFIDFIFTNPQKTQRFACRICNGIDRHDKKLEAFRIDNPDTWLVTLSDGNFEMKGKKIAIPFYAISCIPDLII